MDLCVTYNKFGNMLAAAYVAYMHLSMNTEPEITQ